MINLIPMAGLGSRFSKEGYKDAKPLIPVAGRPMILRAIEMMPKARKWIFVIRQEQVDKYAIDKEIKKLIPNSESIIIDYDTEGQLSSCLLARDWINNDEELFIASCDNGYIWNKAEFNRLRKNADVIPWVFTKHYALKNNPTAWGWVKTDKENKVKGVSVKVPISDDTFNDKAIIATFWFKKGKIFLDIADKILKDNARVNNEFYVDTAIDYAPKMGYNTRAFVVDSYIGWGTPQDYEMFNYFLEIFKHIDKSYFK